MSKTLLAILVVAVVVPGCRRDDAQTAREAQLPEAAAPETPASPQVPQPEPGKAVLTTPAPDPVTWEMAKGRIEELRGGGGRLQVPSELRHYNDRRRFLAVQLADSQVREYDLPHDLGELAVMIRAGELVELPRLGPHHLLYEVGEDARESPLQHYDKATGRDVPLVGSEQELEQLLAEAPARQKTLLEKYYGDPRTRQQLFAEHEAVTQLARDFGGRSYDLADPRQRAAFQRRMLSFLRPEARDVLLEVAYGYHGQFDRLLPVTSVIRTLRYQRKLSRVNPNATTKIDAPPHTTGMAFDISYKFMANDEQNWVMAAVAQLEREDRVEALRERRNHVHVYVFGAEPPGDVQVARYLDDVGPPPRARKRRR